MHIRIAGFELEVNGAGLFVRVPKIGEAFVDFTGQRLTAVNRLR